MNDDFSEGCNNLSVEIISTQADLTTNPTEPTTTPFNNTGSSVQFAYEPQTVGELLRIEYLYRTLSLSKVFIHNRKGESEELIRTASAVIGEYSEIKRFKSHNTKLSSILKKIKNLPAILPKPQVWVIEITDMTADLNRFCVSIDLIKERQIGIWILAHITDISPRIISLFDAFFIFDMPFSQLNYLRTSLSISKENAQMLSRATGESIKKNKVLFFLNFDGKEDLPFLKENPIIISQIQESPMDITPLVPIAVEAAKFLFNEASQLIKTIRRENNQPTEIRKEDNCLSLPVLDRNEFADLESDFETLKNSLDKTALEVNEYRIRGLIKELRTHHKNYTDLKVQAANHGNDIPLSIKRNIDNETTLIISNTTELEDIVSKVYQKKIKLI